MYYLRLFDGDSFPELFPITEREQGIIESYIHWDDMANNPDYSPAHRELASITRAKMESNTGSLGLWVKLYLKGYIWDENRESFKERKEMNKL